MKWLAFYAAVFACGTTALTTDSVATAYGCVLMASALLMRAVRPLLH